MSLVERVHLLHRPVVVVPALEQQPYSDYERRLGRAAKAYVDSQTFVQNLLSDMMPRSSNNARVAARWIHGHGAGLATLFTLCYIEDPTILPTHTSLQHMLYALRLHDLGKLYLGLQADLWDEPIPPDSSLFALIKEHPVKGRHKLLDYEKKLGITLPAAVHNIALLHHENQDGTGYPFGLDRRFIPWEASFARAGDYLLAAVERRRYRQTPDDPDETWEQRWQRAYEPLRWRKGTFFHPDVVVRLEQIADLAPRVLTLDEMSDYGYPATGMQWMLQWSALLR